MTQHRHLDILHPQSPSDTLSTILALDEASPDCTSPDASAFRDIVYGSVTSYSYPATCEPSALTPVSLSGSPPMHHRPKQMPSYQSAAPPSTQQPTPPASSKLSWPHPFEVDTPTSHSGSPLTMHQAPDGQSHVDDLYFTGSPTDDNIPDPPKDQYFGHYGVSETGVKEEPLDQPPMPIFNQPMMGDSNWSYQGHVHADPLPRRIAPPIGHYPALRHAPRLTPDEAAAITMNPHNGSPGRRRGKPNGRISKAPTRKRPSKPGRPGQGESRVADDSLETTVPEFCEPPTLHPETPDKDRYLFEIYFKHRQEKGKSMWEAMQKDFSLKYPSETPTREALQMRMARAKSRYMMFPQKDGDILEEAYREFESNRYNLIHKLFKEKGGGKTSLPLGVSQIELELIKRGLEDVYMDPNTKIRSRKRLSEQRRRSSGRTSDADASRKAFQYGLQGGDMTAMGPFKLTEDEQERIHEQMESRNGYYQHEPSPEPLPFPNEVHHMTPGRGPMIQQDDRLAHHQEDALYKVQQSYYSQSRGM